ncbi:hypothetical protein I2485_14215 [Nesterenkonia sp. E16_7]|uniref:hypothetical protein n=1 Tax=Nesterenkonia sp. E16_7 TaxID=2789294 RepID=UPI001A91FB56|nr:hypothetical protein [Nesterenkonia sp. E16_7]MBO0594607.1 hypothetical protein [Nesterenkonia sp. E16_10]MBO0599800.1 hypothetical protein [Nesterenkonia sp. E16_7]
MGPMFATLAILTGVSLWLLSFRERHMANPGRKIPHFGAPPRSDGRASLYLILGAALLGVTASYVSSQSSLWVGVLPMLSAGLLYSALIYRHNRSIDREDHALSHGRGS